MHTMAQQALIFPTEKVYTHVRKLTFKEIKNEFLNGTDEETPWNGYAAALLSGMEFRFHDLKTFLDYTECDRDWDTTQKPLIVMLWLARNIRLPERYVDLLELVLPDYDIIPDKSPDLLVEVIDVFVRLGMRLTVDQIKGIKGNSSHDAAKSVLMRRMYQLRILDPVDMDVLPYMFRIDGDFVTDLLRVIMIDRQVSLPMLTCYVIDNDLFYEDILLKLYNENVLPVDVDDLYHYNKPVKFDMKYAMLANNNEFDMDRLDFKEDTLALTSRNKVLKVKFEKMKRKLKSENDRLKREFKLNQDNVIALCDNLPVDIVHKIAGMTGLKCLTGPKMLARMIERQVAENKKE